MFPLLRSSRVYALLHYAATVHVASDLRTVDHHSLIDELLVLRLPRIENLLNHMVAVDFERKKHKIAQKVVLQQSLVLRRNQDFN